MIAQANQTSRSGCPGASDWQHYKRIQPIVIESSALCSWVTAIRVHL